MTTNDMIAVSSLNEGHNMLTSTTIVTPTYHNTASITNVPELIAENSKSSNNPSSAGSSTEASAVFLPTYATLPPTTKLEEEPNPFEQSFEKVETVVPSPSIKQTRQNYVNNRFNSIKATFYNHTYENPPPTVNRNLVKNIITTSEESLRPPKRQKRNKSKLPEDEEKRKNFLERNRIAALKCRQRKKQWLQNLQTKVEYLAAENEQYHLQATALREELIQLKMLLMAHKDCPVNQQELKLALSQPVPGISEVPHVTVLSEPDDYK